jgi:hypothetical protein
MIMQNLDERQPSNISQSDTANNLAAYVGTSLLQTTVIHHTVAFNAHYVTHY